MGSGGGQSNPVPAPVTPTTAVPRETSWEVEYKFATETAFIFFEWRHKILVRYAVIGGAVGVVFKYLYDGGFSLVVREVPFAVGVFFSIFFLLSDRVHTKIIKDCYSVGIHLEQEIRRDSALFALLSQRAEKTFWKRGYLLSYRRLLALLFIFGGLSFVAGGIYAAAYM